MNNDICSICLEDFKIKVNLEDETIIKLSCGHMFCYKCFKDSDKCFNCRKPVTSIIKVFKS